MKWFLIYWLTSSAQLVSAPPAILFNDEAACKAALEQIDDSWRGAPNGSLLSYHASKGLCVAQATPEPPPCIPGTWTPPNGPLCTVTQ